MKKSGSSDTLASVSRNIGIMETLWIVSSLTFAGAQISRTIPGTSGPIKAIMTKEFPDINLISAVFANSSIMAESTEELIAMADLSNTLIVMMCFVGDKNQQPMISLVSPGKTMDDGVMRNVNKYIAYNYSAVN